MFSSTYVIYVIISILCFVPAIVLHEVAHGFAAARLGDPTAKSRGRLSLNPLKHVDPFGTVILPMLLMLMGGPVFGYAKPVPYNPMYFKNVRQGEAIVGLAGPAANLAMALVGAAVAWAFVPMLASSTSSPVLNSDLFYYFYVLFLPQFILINLYLMFFNLIPIPPLDGSSVIALFLNDRMLHKYYRIQQYALPVFMAVVVLVPYIFHFNPIGIYLNATAGNLASLIAPFYF
ncbi:site-2 protease family protein [Slackia equolifaciens]|uniref:Site-2 protease family protein n=1 Tax=Slackia equolifaciens TaxID=498718 RepID=A0A3N0AUL6_9ACTN|nr:site-2 protease family protein [Slackia equolifaciens]RNL38535.1 site-2 protease family protein [Slackia equolifaciens]HJF64732.1 site-2 protease family protein [Slackia equolifaciens]